MKRFLWLLVASLIVQVNTTSAAFNIFQTTSTNTCSAAVPAAGSANGVSACAFFDDFSSLSTIDTGNTGAPGFKWYAQNPFPVTSLTNGTTAAGNNTLHFVGTPTMGTGPYTVIDNTTPAAITVGTTITSTTSNTAVMSAVANSPGVGNGDSISFFTPPQPAAKTTITSGVLTLANAGQTVNNISLSTIFMTKQGTGVTNQYVKGFLIKGVPWYAEISMAFDETLGNGTGGLGNKRWPALSAYSWPGTLWGSTSDEWDFPDLLPGVSNVALDFFLHESGNSVNTYTNIGRGQIATHGTITGGSGYVNGTYTNVPLIGSGAGKGAQATVVVSGGAVTTVTITNIGIAFVASENLTVNNANLGGSGSGFTTPVATTTQLAFTAAVFHQYGMYYKPAGAGTGTMSFYFDGINVGTTTFSLAAGSTPSATPSNPNGVFTGAETNGDGFEFSIAGGCQGANCAGGDWPTNVDYFGVWQ